MDGERGEQPIIVLIDDSESDAIHINLVVAQLHTPVQLLTASELVQGLQIVRRTQPRIVLLDVHLAPGDADGRWAVTEIQRLSPHTQIVPYTADYKAGDQMPAFGCCPPIYKSTRQRDIVTYLDQMLQTSIAPPSPRNDHLYAFVQEQAPRMLAAANRRVLRVLLIAGSEVYQRGLSAIIEEVGLQTILCRSVQHLDTFIQSHRTIDIILCTPDAYVEVQRVAQMHYIPLLTYASSLDHLAALTLDTNVVVEPITPTELARALQVVAAGERYNVPYTLMRLSPIQRQLVGLIADQLPNVLIAKQLGITEGYLRHLRSRLCQQLGLANQEALRVWAKDHAQVIRAPVG